MARISLNRKKCLVLSISFLIFLLLSLSCHQSTFLIYCSLLCVCPPVTMLSSCWQSVVLPCCVPCPFLSGLPLDLFRAHSIYLLPDLKLVFFFSLLPSATIHKACACVVSLIETVIKMQLKDH